MTEAPHPSKPALATRVDELREALQRVPVNLLAERTGSNYQALDPERGEFRLALIDSPMVVRHPGFQTFDAQNNELPSFHQALVMYYLHTADGTPLAGKWISFAELPDGRVYNSAFQGSTGDSLVKTFGFDVDSLRQVCEKLGGMSQSGYGDAAYVFSALPRVPIMLNYWCGDEDFPSTCKLLFDESVSHYLPTEACAILGNMLKGRIEKNAQ